MKRVLLSVTAGLIGLWANAQTFGNEWIQYDRQYWSFPITHEGIYRIDSTTLANAGFPIGTVDARTIEIYGRQQQVPLYVEGEGDGVLNGADFIEFYSKGNDAWLDSTLWDTPAHMSNPYYSFYCDTIQYFISWGPMGEA